ncbi:PP2C family protein-serine/threonine phosphatase [Streptomyces monticola]|uniref:PP2C family protein-serine/threonine phosphatase n=1 Tax=Streptomyces monticola TaxID=2666263 RepID=A0ABW2JEQ1_9ACTN
MTDTPNCVECGGTVAPDGHCWDCGAARPAFRAHMEITAPCGAAGVSDRGLRRGVNADAMALTVTGSWTVGVVCDGVSMAPRAERAAQVAAEAGAGVLVARLDEGRLPEHALEEAAARAGRAVAALAAADGAPACTYLAGIAGPQGLWTASIGDSRAYWLPEEGPAAALSEDDRGEHDALTAWLGAGAPDPEPRIRSLRPSGPGRLLLCTDGLTRYLPDATALRETLTRHGAGPGHGEDQLSAARALVGHALHAGGADNVTAVCIPVAPPPPSRRQVVRSTPA